MSQSTDTGESEQSEGSDDDRPSRAGRARSIAARGIRSGTAASLAGGVLLAGAVRTAGRARRRAGVLALLGGALLGAGLRQRRSGEDSSEAADADADENADADDDEDEDETTSAEARANRERSDVLNQSETNPRGASGEPEIETETDPDDGDVRFTTEQDEDPEPKPKPNLEETNGDPRDPTPEDAETPDDHVTVDLSEAAMADEASEAAGPDDEQAYPAEEGTDPEPMSEDAPERRGHGAVANKDRDSKESQADDEPETDEESEADDERDADEGAT